MGRVLRAGETFTDALKEAGEFFVKEGIVWATVARVTERLAQNGIDYALIGGIAMAAHGYMRYTADVDLLVTPQDVALVFERLCGDGHTQLSARRLRDDVTGVQIDLFTGSSPAAVAVEIDGVHVVRLEKLIDFKLTSGRANPHRLHDLADVQRLIEGLDLPLDFADKLDPSVRDTFIQYWHFHQNATGPDRE